MTIGYDAALIIVVMAVAVALCRLGGFWAMGFVTITPRIESGLKAIPLAVMIGIMLPPILHGGIAETAGVATTIAGVRLGANDLAAILIGLATVAALRQFT